MFLFTTLYTQLTVLIFDEGGKLENLQKNPHGMRKNNTLNKNYNKYIKCVTRG